MPLFDIPFGFTIGPQRAGTTWIYNYLKARGDICLPRSAKETFFFDRHYKKGIDFYKKLFRIKSKHKMAIEVAATSFTHPEVPARVHNQFGSQLKLICPLRHPVSRSYSLYKHFLQYGFVKGTLEQALKTRPDIITSSHYSEHLHRWFKIFGQENIPIIFIEELQSSPETYIKKICSHFEIEYKAPLINMRHNKANQAAKPPNPHLARIGQLTADWLRDNQAYGIIKTAKKMGLKRLFFGTGRRIEDHGICPNDIDLLDNKLKGQTEALEQLLGHKIDLWHDDDKNLFSKPNIPQEKQA